MVAKLGDIEVGAVFPPVSDVHDRYPWVWRFWLGDMTTPRQQGCTKSELAAKNSLIARVEEWLRAAGLQQVEHA
jgi:hypothetical protein